jgi:CBS domain-containing protein
MARLARDVMQSFVLKVTPETPLIDIQRLFVEEEINGAPVVDDTDRLLGVVTSMDLLRAVEEEHGSEAMETTYFRDFFEFSGPDWNRSPEDFQDRLAERTVADVMTPGGVTVAPDTPIPEVAATMRKHHVHRVFVVDGEVLVGLISTFDLVALLEKG